MDYTEIHITLSPFNQDLSDILIAELGELSFDSFTELEDGFNAYIPSKNYDEQQLNTLLADYRQQVMLSMEKSDIKAQNWNAVWESNFNPIVVDGRCVIRAPFHTDCPKLTYDIVIEPKMSFGTGHHDTTYLMAEWLLDADVEGKTLLDMGCGTGILAILAALRNAEAVDAIDIDEWAYENTVENAATNGVSAKIKAVQGDASLLTGKQYDLILANINRNILLQDMVSYTQSLSKGGTLVVSGIFTEDIPVVEEEAVQQGLQKVEEKSRNRWARIVFSK